MKFEWDPKKAASNIKKHGLSFEESLTAFDDPHALIEAAERHSTVGEKRAALIGEASPGVLVVIFTVRDSGKIYRVISARSASRKERRLYEESKAI